MAELCDHCGHPLPNSVPVGYCNECGEPVGKPQGLEKIKDSPRMTKIVNMMKKGGRR